MLLEVAYRAMEDAGQPAERIAGESVSVYVGISSFDYAVANLSFQDRGVIDAYSNTGGSSSIAANRISYCFDLRGPSVAVDTACSSSLVAVHMACESIWRGDAKLALAGGVNALLMPDFYVAFSQLGVLSPDGRCKTFDSRANGYVRSEGAGMIMLKPLSAALRDKDSVYAVIRATALNQDGRTPGMTVPSQDAQESLLRKACNKAGISPADVQYVEAHGTGTPVGDPIEARALGSVLGENRQPGERCRIGSVKTNIGHLEAGAGIASVIKVALALHHRRIPAHLHFQQPNPEINFEDLNLQVPLESQDWDSNVSRIAGVNGFGYGGANAHVILEEAPSSETVAQHALPVARDGAVARETETTPILLPLSARSKSALTQYSASLADWLDANPEYHLAELAGYLAHRRSHQAQRATACASSRTELISELRSLAASAPEELAEDFSPARLDKGAVFACSGQGPQWWAMGRGMLRFSPAFRSVIKKCDNEFSKLGEWSLLEELTRSEETSRMQQTSIAQPSIFAIQVALAAVWESWGVTPSVVVGHSVGEIAAAYLSGALSWEDSCAVAFHRGRTMDLATSRGAMVAAGISPDEVPAWVQEIEKDVSIAAINGPTSVTISGDKDAIEGLANKLDDAGIFCRRLEVEYAFHSPQMEPVREELLRSLAHIRPRKTHTDLVSTVTGKLAEGTEFGAEYWWQNVRQGVRFADAMEYLANEGYGLAVEVGPHPVLAYAINECFQAAGKSVRSVPSLSKQQDDLQCMSKSLGSLYSMGFDIDWSGFYNQPTRKLPVPTYPFQTQKLWSESIQSETTRLAETQHPLLGVRADSASLSWEGRIDVKLQRFLKDHKVRSAIVYPAAAMVETAIAAAQTVFETDHARLGRIELQSACMISEDNPQWIQTKYDQDRRQLNLSVRPCDSTEWTPLATIRPSSDAPPAAQAAEEELQQQIMAIRQRCSEQLTQPQLYTYCDRIGLNYGPTFQAIREGWRCSGEALCELMMPEELTAEAKSDYALHPAFLDGCFHSMIAADPHFDQTLDGLYLPVEIDEFCFYRSPGAKATVHTTMLSKTKKYLICDLNIFDGQGRLCAAIKGFKSMRVAGGTNIEETEDLIYSYSWMEQDVDSENTQEPGRPKHWVLFMDESGCGRELAARLRQRGDLVSEIYRDGSLVPQTQAPFYEVDPEDQASFSSVFAEIHKQEQDPEHLVYLWGLDVPAVSAISTANLDASCILSSLAPMHLVQAWDKLEGGSVADLSIVTSGAQSQDGEPEATNLAQGPLVGFGRVIVSEFGPLRSKLIDLPSQISAHDLDHLTNELLADDEEDEVLWRDGGRFVHRFGPQAGKAASREAADTLACQLRVGNSSGVEELHYETKSELPLETGQVEIEVASSGLNFSDVMKALDLYPGLPDGPIDLGAECAGRISRVAKGSSWRVGDEVMAVAPGSFGTHVVVSEHLVARKPCNLSYEQAATLPIAFLTADYAMNYCARMQQGESLLVHSASGGVGLAAMQLAKLQGIKVFATAGTDEKRLFVKDRGAAVVMDSRSLAFADATLQATGGEGVDAVLNSLPGEAIPKGISTLKTGGRFLEIGKRDIYSDGALGLYPFRNNLALFAIDLDQLFKQQPKMMGERLRALVPRFESGELEALPITSFDVDDTVAAFRFMQQGNHIGKVAVNYNS
ncbi:MAG: acyltransferase domain-containing protein, partial [Planctomycetota bacterium]